MATALKNNEHKRQDAGTCDTETLLVSLDQLCQVMEVMQATIARLKSQMNHSQNASAKPARPLVKTVPSQLSTSQNQGHSSEHSIAIIKALAERKNTVLH